MEIYSMKIPVVDYYYPDDGDEMATLEAVKSEKGISLMVETWGKPATSWEVPWADVAQAIIWMNPLLFGDLDEP